MSKKMLGFIGCGNMASAIINCIVESNVFPVNNICVYDINEEKCNMLKSKTGINVVCSINNLVEDCNVIFLAIKPQNFPEVLASLKPIVNKQILFVSIAAGISTRFIIENLGCQCPVVRTMPNTPLLIGEGATAICRTQNVNDKDFSLIQSIFSSCGTVTVLKESQMNAVISVNSSSPAYIYLFAKSMLDSAEKQGIDKKTAMKLICQTLLGSSEMLLKSGYTPEELIKMVSSPGGTTLKALEVLYSNDFEQIIDKAMKACTNRANELGQ